MRRSRAALTKPLLAALLGAVLALTSVTMAMARGQTRDMAGQIVICSGAGVTTISVDRDGHPVQQIHLCPDMVLGLLATLDLPDPAVLRPQTRAEDLVPAAAPHRAAATAPQPRARSPPVA
ncbi:hypothetical protein ACEYYA_01490 [Paracoccus sp. p3-h83]|uniref:hypothetical protein n=1 Tax=Paracoccus sp. p3-h83 TaxID=3342805 RepID=UPI0035B98A39